MPFQQACTIKSRSTSRLFLFFASLLFPLMALAIQPFIIKDMKVDGVQRTEAGTVFSYLPVKVGEQMDDEKAAAAIKALYATGFYTDVRLEVENDVLHIYVQERPAIAKIDIIGSKEFTKENLTDGLKQAGISEAKIFDRSVLDRAEKEIKRQYTSRGFYSAKVTTTVTPLERNRISLTFNIEEGDSSRIVDINIIGATVFSERELLNEFELTTTGWLSWISKDDQYSKQKLSGDLEKLRSYYQNRGYLEFNIDSTQVSITPDKEKIFITVTITEGPVYKISETKVAGDLKVPEEELTRLMQFDKDEVFSRQKIIDTVKRMTDRLGNDGYSFANINPVPELNKEKQTAVFTFFVDPGRRVYIRHINIQGNARTRDEVVRREMRQLEASWYSISAINRSKERLDRTGFFEEVNIETPAVPGTPDQVDVVVTVKERNTGSLQFGVGYSQQERLSLNASVSQSNIFGTGNQLGFAVNTGAINKTFDVSYLNPYWSIDGVSRGFSLYRRDFNSASLSTGDYESTSTGGSVSFGVPVTEFDTINFGLGLERTQLSLTGGSPQQYFDYATSFGTRSDTVRGIVGYARDTRDSIYFPTRGHLYEASVEAGLPGGDIKYYRASLHAQYLRPIWGPIVGSASANIGYADGYGGKALPFFKNFYTGGVDSIRGFQSASLGPVDSNGSSLGGNRSFVYNLELLFPLPGVKTDKGVRLSVFFDAGNVFGRSERVHWGEMRSSTGLSVSWFSPVGPLKFSLAKPIRTKPSDQTERFQFLLGRAF